MLRSFAATRTISVSLLLIVLVQLFRGTSESEGTCSWSGKAPDCGNGRCQDSGWYAIGNSAVDEGGEECYPGIKNLYCCPKERKPRSIQIRLCTKKAAQGDCFDIHETDTECVQLPGNLNVKSVITWCGCVRLYQYFSCSGYSQALHPGNSANHGDLDKFNFKYKAQSVGPCFRSDFCTGEAQLFSNLTSYILERATSNNIIHFEDIDNGCKFPLEQLFMENYKATDWDWEWEYYYQFNVSTHRYYQLEHTTGVSFFTFRTKIKSEQLDTGSGPTLESLKYLDIFEFKSDVIGMFVPPSLGGQATTPSNIFPLTSDFNIHVALKTYEDIFYKIVKRYGDVDLFISSVYFHPYIPTRPDQIVFSIQRNDSNGPIFQDSVPNPRPIIVNSKEVINNSVVYNSSLTTTTAYPTTQVANTRRAHSCRAEIISTSSVLSPQEGHCVWSSAAPGCNDSVCLDYCNWYVLGQGTVEESWNTCALEFSNFYWCPKKRKVPPINLMLCNETNLGGSCFEIHKTDTECVTLADSVKNVVNSVFTFGGCVRVYSFRKCSGKSVALHQGNYVYHSDLAMLNFGNYAESVGPCLRNDFCYPQKMCRFLFEEFFVGFRDLLKVTRMGATGKPVIFYQLGFKSRTEYIRASIKVEHLNTGKDPMEHLSLVYIRSRGLESDIVGMLIPKRIGGDGDFRNIFPLTPDRSILTALKTYEDIVYDLVRKHGEVDFHVNLQYRTPNETRPIQIVFGVHNSSDVLFQDSVPNPKAMSGIPESAPTSIVQPTITNNPTKERSDNQHVANTSVFYIVLLFVLIFLILVITLYIFHFRKAEKGKNDTINETVTDAETEKEDLKITNKPIHLLESTFIIPNSHVVIDRNARLGEGEFGTVYKGTLSTNYFKSDAKSPSNCTIADSASESVFKTVAVKVHKDDVSQCYRDALVSEINVLAGVGVHPNVVRFYGVVKENYVNGELIVVIEFCENGCLQALLIESGHKLRKGLSDLNILNYEIDGAYTFRDQMGFSLQLVSGMEYLESKKVIHGDLATRNLLVNDAGVVKISDFGLSKQLANYDIYMRTSQCPLPWRWMSPEALKKRCFSVKSDVWSFGVTLWEIFTYGSIPYPGLTWTCDFLDLVESGTYRLPKPRYATTEIYNIIGKCLSVDMEDRPSFKELRSEMCAIFEKMG